MSILFFPWIILLNIVIMFPSFLLGERSSILSDYQISIYSFMLIVSQQYCYRYNKNIEARSLVLQKQLSRYSQISLSAEVLSLTITAGLISRWQWHWDLVLCSQFFFFEFFIMKKLTSISFVITLFNTSLCELCSLAWW